MITIRKYQHKDKIVVERICIGESAWGKDEKMRAALLTSFCYYYIDCEPENCFVSVNENDEAIGYILCASNFENWKSVFTREYLNNTDNPVTKAMGESTINCLAPHAEHYPAHLHIDIMNGYQGQGIGSQLLNALKSHLKQIGVQGLMLDVATENKNATRFYLKHGFITLSESSNECIMGILL